MDIAQDREENDGLENGGANMLEGDSGSSDEDESEHAESGKADHVEDSIKELSDGYDSNSDEDREETNRNNSSHIDQLENEYQMDEGRLSTTQYDRNMGPTLSCLPFNLLKAFFLYYETDEMIMTVINSKSTCPSAVEVFVSRLGVINRIDRILQSKRRASICINYILEILFDPDVAMFTQLVTPIQDVMCEAKQMQTDMIPLYHQQMKHFRSLEKSQNTEEAMRRDYPFLAFFMRVVLRKSDYFKNGKATEKFQSVYEDCRNVEKETTQLHTLCQLLLDKIRCNKAQYSSIKHPAFTMKCLNLMSSDTLRGLLSVNCFDVHRFASYVEHNDELLRWIIFVATVDCAICKHDGPENEERFKRIVFQLNSALKHDMTTNLFLFSECSPNIDRDNRRPSQPDISSLLSAQVPVVHHYLLRHKQNLTSTTSPMESLSALDTLLRSATWDAMPQSSIAGNIDAMLNMTTNLCSWIKRYDSNGRGVVVDSDKKRNLKEIILTNSGHEILQKALMAGAPYEVMRCFHVSPVIVSEDRRSGSDRRSQAKEISKACILFIMLSGVRNVVFRPSSETSCDTVVITARARHGYTAKQANLNITLQSEDSQVLSMTCLEQVLKAIQKKENITI